LFGNSYVWIVIGACALLQLAYVHTAPLQAVFHSTDLSLAEWGRVMLVGLLVFTIAETEKAVIRSVTRNNAVPGAAPSGTR
jgi:magnesium-transporting ATPase (P-type)